MKFLLDQDVYAVTERFLGGQTHSVVTARQLGMSQAPDEELLKVAQAERRILVTRDRDFGHLVFVQGMAGGVIYLRALPSTIHVIHKELERVISAYTEQELLDAFVVIGVGGHRIRRLGAPGPTTGSKSSA